MDVELLTTEGCHLCEQAEKLITLALPGVQLSRVDIAEQDELIALYGTRIPVIRCQGRELAWPFSLLDLRGLLAG